MKDLRNTLNSRPWPLISALIIMALLFGLVPTVVSAQSQAPACAATVPAPLPFFIITENANEMVLGVCSANNVPIVDGQEMTPVSSGSWNYQIAVTEGIHTLSDGGESIEFDAQNLTPGESWSHNWMQIDAVDYTVNLLAWFTIDGEETVSLTGWAFRSYFPQAEQYWNFDTHVWSTTPVWSYRSVVRIPAPPTATPTNTTVPPTATLTPTPSLTPTETIVVPPTETATPTATATPEPPACLALYPSAPFVTYERYLVLGVCSTEEPVITKGDVVFTVEKVDHARYNWRVTQPVKPGDYTVTAGNTTIPVTLGNVQATDGVIDLGVVNITAHDGAVGAVLMPDNVVAVHGWTYGTAIDWQTYKIEGWKNGAWVDADFWGEYTILHIKQIRFLNFLPNVQNSRP